MEYQVLIVSMVYFFYEKEDIIDERRKFLCQECFEIEKDSFCYVGRNDVNLNVLNFELDRYKLFYKEIF